MSIIHFTFHVAMYAHITRSATTYAREIFSIISSIFSHISTLIAAIMTFPCPAIVLISFDFAAPEFFLQKPLN